MSTCIEYRIGVFDTLGIATNMLSTVDLADLTSRFCPSAAVGVCTLVGCCAGHASLANQHDIMALVLRHDVSVVCEVDGKSTTAAC